MAKVNGETSLIVEEVGFSTKLDVIISALSDLTERVEELKVQQEELVEKISNLSLSGVDFEVYEES